ncbi:MAG TPA: DNA primase catalytic subunit PriS [Candidatus Methanoperedens sp.]
MNFRTKQYLRKKFGDYYQTFEPTLPPDFTKREWGFIFFEELPEVVMHRHKAFSSEGEAFEYIRGMVPAHVYHSAAYYEFPGAGTMKEKQWEGADLIFDLDADHLPQKAGSYAGMLENVKKETGKLLEFLLDDFGFSGNDIGIVFSGGRGYHIHVRDPKVMTLGSAERREIVDYVGGTGLAVDFLFKTAKHVVYETGRFKKTELESSRKISSFDDARGGFGWGKRISRYIIHFVEGISTVEEREALNEILKLIKNYNFKKASIRKFPEDITDRIKKIRSENRKTGIQKIADEVGISVEQARDILIINGLWDFKPEAMAKLRNIREIAQNPGALDNIANKGILGDSYIFDAIVEKAIEDNSINLGSAHTDEPVTADIRRLIRMPSSLHGGSGMRVVPLALSGFEKFEPLIDAVVFGEKDIRIEMIPPLKPQNSLVEMKGKSFRVEEGINTLPEYAAIYLMCRGAAEYA